MDEVDYVSGKTRLFGIVGHPIEQVRSPEMITAEMTGRACHALELSPAYVDVAIQRWQAFAGEQATLHATGETFAAVSAQRVKEPADVV